MGTLEERLEVDYNISGKYKIILKNLNTSNNLYQEYEINLSDELKEFLEDKLTSISGESIWPLNDWNSGKYQEVLMNNFKIVINNSVYSFYKLPTTSTNDKLYIHISKTPELVSDTYDNCNWFLKKQKQYVRDIIFNDISLNNINAESVPRLKKNKVKIILNKPFQSTESIKISMDSGFTWIDMSGVFNDSDISGVWGCVSTLTESSRISDFECERNNQLGLPPKGMYPTIDLSCDEDMPPCGTYPTYLPQLLPPPICNIDVPPCGVYPTYLSGVPGMQPYGIYPPLLPVSPPTLADLSLTGVSFNAPDHILSYTIENKGDTPATNIYTYIFKKTDSQWELNSWNGGSLKIYQGGSESGSTYSNWSNGSFHHTESITKDASLNVVVTFQSAIPGGDYMVAVNVNHPNISQWLESDTYDQLDVSDNKLSSVFQDASTNNVATFNVHPLPNLEVTGAEYNYSTSILKYKIKNTGKANAVSDDSISTHIFKKNTDSRWEIFIFPEDTPSFPLLNELAPDASFNISLNLSLPRGEFMIVANVGKGIIELDDYEKLIMVDGRLPVDLQDVSTNNAALVIPKSPNLEVIDAEYDYTTTILKYKIKNIGNLAAGSGNYSISTHIFKRNVESDPWEIFTFPDDTPLSSLILPSAPYNNWYNQDPDEGILYFELYKMDGGYVKDSWDAYGIHGSLDHADLKLKYNNRKLKIVYFSNYGGLWSSNQSWCIKLKDNDDGTNIVTDTNGTLMKTRFKIWKKTNGEYEELGDFPSATAIEWSYLFARPYPGQSDSAWSGLNASVFQTDSDDYNDDVRIKGIMDSHYSKESLTAYGLEGIGFAEQGHPSNPLYLSASLIDEKNVSSWVPPVTNYLSSTILQNELAPDASFDISLNLSLPDGEFMIVANVGKEIIEFDERTSLLMEDDTLPVGFQDVSTNNAALVNFDPTFPDLEVGEISYNYLTRQLTYNIYNRGGPIPGEAKVISQIFFKKDNKWKVYPEETNSSDWMLGGGDGRRKEEGEDDSDEEIISTAVEQLMALHGYTITSDGTTGKLSMLNALALVSSAIIDFGPNIFGGEYLVVVNAGGKIRENKSNPLEISEDGILNAAPSYISDASFNAPFPNLSMIDVSYNNGELLYSIKNSGGGSAPPGIVVHIFEWKNENWQIFRFPENTTGHLFGSEDSWVDSTQSHMPLIDTDMDIQHHPDTPSLYIDRSWMIKHSTTHLRNDVHKGKLTFAPPLQGGKYMIVVNLPPFFKTINGQLHDWEFVQEEEGKSTTKDYSGNIHAAGMLHDNFEPDETNNAFTFVVQSGPTAPIGWYSPNYSKYTTTASGPNSWGLANIYYKRSLHKFVYSAALMYASKNVPDNLGMDPHAVATQSEPWNIKKLRFLVVQQAKYARKNYQIAMKNIDSDAFTMDIGASTSDWEVVRHLDNFQPSIGYFEITLDNEGFQWTGGDLAFSFGWAGNGQGWNGSGRTYYFTTNDSTSAKAWYRWDDNYGDDVEPFNYKDDANKTTPNIPFVEFEFEE